MVLNNINAQFNILSKSVMLQLSLKYEENNSCVNRNCYNNEM